MQPASFPPKLIKYLRRTNILETMKYSEFAVGDAYKTAVLCRNIREVLDGKSHFRLGVGCGTWMSDDDVSSAAEMQQGRERQQEQITSLNSAAARLMSAHLTFPNGEVEAGRFRFSCLFPVGL